MYIQLHVYVYLASYFFISLENLISKTAAVFFTIVTTAMLLYNMATIAG